jgi:hypothetical protein
MSERGTQLFQIAEGQLSELIELISTRDEAALNLPCPAREKLGDGTVAACRVAQSRELPRIAAFLRDEDHPPPAHAQKARGPHRIPSFLRARGHGNSHSHSTHSAPHGAENVDRQGLLDRLSAGRDALGLLGELTDAQLDSVPPAGDMKFCDGQRTLDQVVASLLNHQSHQLDALRAAFT